VASRNVIRIMCSKESRLLSIRQALTLPLQKLPQRLFLLVHW